MLRHGLLNPVLLNKPQIDLACPDNMLNQNQITCTMLYCMIFKIHAVFICMEQTYSISAFDSSN